MLVMQPTLSRSVISPEYHYYMEQYQNKLLKNNAEERELARDPLENEEEWKNEVTEALKSIYMK